MAVSVTLVTRNNRANGGIYRSEISSAAVIVGWGLWIGCYGIWGMIGSADRFRDPSGATSAEDVGVVQHFDVGLRRALDQDVPLLFYGHDDFLALDRHSAGGRSDVPQGKYGDRR
jgi:hypothetical protein